MKKLFGQKNDIINFISTATNDKEMDVKCHTEWVTEQQKPILLQKA
jgi:hypothetical protein